MLCGGRNISDSRPAIDTSFIYDIYDLKVAICLVGKASNSLETDRNYQFEESLHGAADLVIQIFLQDGSVLVLLFGLLIM